MGEQSGTCCVYCTKGFGDDARLESEPYRCLDNKIESAACLRDKFTSDLPRCPYRVHWEAQKAGGIPWWASAILLAVILVVAIALIFTLRPKASQQPSGPRE